MKGLETSHGVIYTFYSYKGGTGRTMALANVAALLSKWGHKVLAVDWDLEAPGVGNFFGRANFTGEHVGKSLPGVLDLIQATPYDSNKLSWRDCLLRLDSGPSIISAGRYDGEYVTKLHELNVEGLFAKYNLGAYLEQLRTEWTSEFDFVLIDSRTGVTDIGGLCTVHLPDILVVFFTATTSSIDGTVRIVERARKAQGRLPLDRGHLIAVWSTRLSGRKVASIVGLVSSKHVRAGRVLIQLSCLGIGTFFERIHWGNWHRRLKSMIEDEEDVAEADFAKERSLLDLHSSSEFPEEA